MTYRIVKIDSRECGNNMIADLYDHVFVIEQQVTRKVGWFKHRQETVWVRVDMALSLGTALNKVEKIKHPRGLIATSEVVWGDNE